MGCIGMSRTDFERCTPSELKAIWDKWQEREEAKTRDEWERLRWLMLYVTQPHSKKVLELEDVLKLPWDKLKQTINPDRPQSDEDARSRFEAAKKRYGLK